MIPPAPATFWSDVVARVASLVFERETALSAGAGIRLAPAAERRPGTMPTFETLTVETKIGGAAE